MYDMEFVTKKEMAAMLKLSTRTIDRHRAAGLDLGAVKIGRRIRFRLDKAKAQLEKLAERQRR